MAVLINFRVGLGINSLATLAEICSRQPVSANAARAWANQRRRREKKEIFCQFSGKICHSWKRHENRPFGLKSDKKRQTTFSKNQRHLDHKNDVPTRKFVDGNSSSENRKLKTRNLSLISKIWYWTFTLSLVAGLGRRGLVSFAYRMKKLYLPNA